MILLNSLDDACNESLALGDPPGRQYISLMNLVDEIDTYSGMGDKVVVAGLYVLLLDRFVYQRLFL